MKKKTNPTRDQRSLIGEFMARDEAEKDVELFNKAFDITIKLDRAKATLDEASSKAYRSILRKKIRFYENRITPAPKLAGIDRNYDLNEFLTEYLRQHGRPRNVGLFISWMSTKGLLDVADAEGNVRTLNDRTVRNMIENLMRPFSWPEKA